MRPAWCLGGEPKVVWAFDGYVLDLDRRELRQGSALIELEPQVFDVLAYLVRHRDRVVGKDELLQAVWCGRIVSDSALTTRINAVRRAVGDTGKAQRLLRTHPRKGIRFVGEVTEPPTEREPAKFQPRSGATPRSPAAALVDGSSIAVLPFTAISGAPEERWLADGLVENAVAALSRFQWLSVVAPMSHPGPHGRAFDVTWIGCELGVRYVVQGTVHRGGQRLRVTARLMDANSGLNLWADRFDGPFADGFELQDMVTATMAGSIAPIVQAAEARRLNASPDRDATPHDLHLRAQPIFSNGKESILRSLKLLERALALDPDYAPALADAANCLQLLDINGWAEDRRVNRQKAVDFTRRALRVSGEPEPAAAAAQVLAYFGEDIDVALAVADQAMTLNPNFARGWFSSGMAQLYAGRPEQAVESFEKSVRLNPRDRVGRRNIAGIGIAHFFDRRFDEAAPRLRLTVQEFPRWATPYCVLVSCYAHLGLVREAEALARRLRATDPSLMPNAAQFRNARHRELLAPGLRLTGTSR